MNAFVYLIESATKQQSETSGSGCVLQVDFTASNGDPSDPRSLHWTDPDGSSENQYQAAIRAVGEVIENYDTDRLFPVFGCDGRIVVEAFCLQDAHGLSQSLETVRVTCQCRFGGKFPSLSEAQCHCVNICPGGNPVQGVEGILDAYVHR